MGCFTNSRVDFFPVPKVLDIEDYGVPQDNRGLMEWRVEWTNNRERVHELHGSKFTGMMP